MTKKTCGEFYKAALAEFREFTSYEDIFAIGFVCGQAEKSMLHACEAAMFRPSEDRAEFLLGIVERVSALHGLCWRFLAYSHGAETIRELWLCRGESAARQVQSMETMEVNSPAWHATRGQLVGIPSSEIDFAYHQRPCFGERCD